jgi:hypothetical protein
MYVSFQAIWCSVANDWPWDAYFEYILRKAAISSICLIQLVHTDLKNCDLFTV